MLVNQIVSAAGCSEIQAGQDQWFQSGFNIMYENVSFHFMFYPVILRKLLELLILFFRRFFVFTDVISRDSV